MFTWSRIKSSHCEGEARSNLRLLHSLRSFAMTMFLVAISIGTVPFGDSPSAYAVTDSYLEDFNSRQSDVTIDGVDSWGVSQGGTSNAVVQESVTPTGTGKSLKITGATPTVIAARSASYGSVSPTWVRYLVRAISGTKQRSVPSSGIAAVTFNYTGKILANDGTSWVDTGQTWEAGEWYEVILKLDFTTHRYDLYISPVAVPKTQFIPVKSNLQFIDTSVTKLSKFNYYGAYSTSQTATSYVDDVSVTYIYRLEFITTPQTVVQDAVSSPMTVQLQSFYAEPQTAIEDYILDLKSTSAGGKFSLTQQPWGNITQITLPKFSQSVSFYYKDSAVGSPIITVSEYVDKGWVDALQEQRVILKTAHFEVSATTPQVAGGSFALTIISKTENGDIDREYSGTVDLAVTYVSPSSGTKQLSVTSASGFSEGRLELPISYPDAGTISIAVSDHDDPSKNGTSGSILFLPDSFSVSVQDASQIVGKPFELTVGAKNIQGQLTPNYKSNVKLTPVFVNPISVEGAAFSPGTIEGTAFSGGNATLAVGYNRWGTIKLKVEDALYPAKTGESSQIKFVPQAVKITVSVPPSGRDFFYIGEVFTVEVSIDDAGASPIPNFIGNVSIATASNLNLPSEYTFIGADQGKHKFNVSANSVGTYTVTAREPDSGLAATSSQIVVKNATLVVIDTTSPIGTTEVIIQLVDDEGNLITTESQLEILITLIEAIDNISASSPSTVTPVRFVNGQVRVPVSDTEGEEVGIEPLSQLGLKVRKGKVTFGRVAKRGIGTLLWREIKEQEKP